MKAKWSPVKKVEAIRSTSGMSLPFSLISEADLVRVSHHQ